MKLLEQCYQMLLLPPLLQNIINHWLNVKWSMSRIVCMILHSCNISLSLAVNNWSPLQSIAPESCFLGVKMLMDRLPIMNIRNKMLTAVTVATFVMNKICY
jgi:hypothetical protein